MQTTFEKDLVDLRSSVESMDAAKTERIGSPSLGDVVRQGDLYLVCIEDLPKGKTVTNRQLAPGTSQGSRHIISDVSQVEMVEVTQFREIPQELVGPAFKCKTAAEITHPEHGNKILPTDTSWQVIYQLAHADEVRRVKD